MRKKIVNLFVFILILICIIQVTAFGHANIKLELSSSGNLISISNQANLVEQELSFLSSENPDVPSPEVLRDIGINPDNPNPEGLDQKQWISQLKQKALSSLTPDAKALLEHVEEIKKYMNNNFRDSKGVIGRVEFDENGNTIIKEGSFINLETPFAKLPSGLKFETENEQVVLKREPKLYFGLQIKDTDYRIGKFKFESSLTDEIHYSINENGVEEFKILGDFVSVQIEDEKYNGITGTDGKNVVFRVNSDGEVEYAEFISVKGGVYNFNFNGNDYSFRSKYNGKVFFDPKNNKISGDKAILDYYDKGFSNNFKIDSSRPFSIELKNGNPNKINLEDGATFIQFGEFTSTKGPLTVFLDGENIKDFNGNAISFNNEDFKTNLKGFVRAVGIEGTIDYEGLSQNAYTEFNRDLVHFEVQEGDARIDNGKHEILVEDGKAKLRVKNGNVDNPTSFSFSSYDEGKEIKGYLDELGDKYSITSYDNNGQLKTISIPLSEFDASFSGSSAELLNLASQEELIPSLEKRLQEIDDAISQEREKLKELGLENSKELESLEFQKIIGEKSLSVARGLSLESSIDDIRNYVGNVKNAELKTNAEMLLGDWIIKNTDSEVPNIPRITRATIRDIIDDTITSTIDLEVKQNGEISAYYIYGKRYEFNGDETIIPEDLIGNSRSLIEHIINKGNKLENLDSFYSARLESENIGFSIDSSEYKTIASQYEEARKWLTDVKINADEKLSGIADLTIARSYDALEGSHKVIQEYERIIGENKNPSIKSEASRLIGVTLFSEFPRENAQASMRYLKSAIEDFGVENPTAIENLKAIKLSLIDDRTRVYHAEPYKLLNDIYSILGEGSSNPWLERIQNGLFHPASTWYYQLSGRVYKLSEIQGRLIGENNLRILGANGMRSLIANGVDIQDYTKSSLIQKFELISEFNGLDRTISLGELNGYMGKAGVDFSSADSYYREVQRLFETIESERGPLIANDYFNDFNKALHIVGAVDYSMENDPALHLIATDSEILTDIKYSGEQSLETAFTSDRAGEAIERNFVESVVLQVADFGVSILGLGGIAGTVTKVVGAGAEAIGAGRTFGLVRSVLSPAETLALRTIGETAPKTALGVGLLGEIGTQTAIYYGLNMIDPRIAEVYDVVSIFGGAGGKKLSQEISLIQDSAGNTKLFVRAESDAIAEQLTREFRNKGLDVEAGTSLPKGFNEIATGSLNDIIKTTSTIARQGQESLMRLTSSDLTPSEIVRIKNGDYTPDEIQRIEKAKTLLRENGFNNEADLLNYKENADELLFSHYSGNKPDGINVFSKARPLMAIGFSKDSIRVLGDNNVIGTLEEKLKISEVLPAIARNEDVLKKGFDNFVENSDIRDLEAVKITRVGKTLYDEKGGQIKNENQLWEYLDSYQDTIRDRIIVTDNDRIIKTRELTDSIEASGRFGKQIFQKESPKLQRDKLDSFLYDDLEIAAIKAKVLDNVEVIPFNEYYNNLIKSTDQVNKILALSGKPYIRILGKTSHDSVRWASDLADHRLTTRPKESTYIPSSRSTREYLIKKWIDEGIDTFVIFDDAAYSGTQLTNDYLYGIGKPYSEVSKVPTFYFVVPYTTDYARLKILNPTLGYNVKTRIHWQKSMKSLNQILSNEELDLYIESADPDIYELYQLNNQRFNPYEYSPGLTLFDHSIPDYLSLDPNVETLFDPSHNPIYKVRDTPYFRIIDLEYFRFFSSYNIYLILT